MQIPGEGRSGTESVYRPIYEVLFRRPQGGRPEGAFGAYFQACFARFTVSKPKFQGIPELQEGENAFQPMKVVGPFFPHRKMYIQFTGGFSTEKIVGDLQAGFHGAYF
jgi:hypothetical protein